MNKIHSAFSVVLLLGFLVVIGCKDNTPPPKTDVQIQTEKLSKTWVVQQTASAVTISGTDVSSAWSSFTLTISDGSYSTNGADNVLVWPSSGTWDFATGDVSTVVRDDGVQVSVSVTDSSLTLSFNFSSTGGRLTGIDGNWIFIMAPQ